MERRRRLVLAGCLLATAVSLASCSGSPAPRAAPAPATTTTTTTTSPPTTLPQGVAVPNVVGMKFDLVRFYLMTAGFALVGLNAACNKGTEPSQSVAASLSIPGRPPNVTVGAQPLLPGTLFPRGARVGVTWSGCFPAGTTVPLVTGHTFAGAVHLLHLAALNWACYSVGENPTTTTRPPRTSTTLRVTTSTADATSSTTTTTTTTTLPTTTTTVRPPERVIGQGTKAGTAAQAGAVVALVMRRCPQ